MMMVPSLSNKLISVCLSLSSKSLVMPKGQLRFCFCELILAWCHSGAAQVQRSHLKHVLKAMSFSAHACGMHHCLCFVQGHVSAVIRWAAQVCHAATRKLRGHNPDGWARQPSAIAVAAYETRPGDSWSQAQRSWPGLTLCLFQPIAEDKRLIVSPACILLFCSWPYPHYPVIQ